jgi:hypothetical protein
VWLGKSGKVGWGVARQIRQGAVRRGSVGLGRSGVSRLGEAR